jgi:hypothetical protein
MSRQSSCVSGRRSSRSGSDPAAKFGGEAGSGAGRGLLYFEAAGVEGEGSSGRIVFQRRPCGAWPVGTSCPTKHQSVSLTPPSVIARLNHGQWENRIGRGGLANKLLVAPPRMNSRSLE